MDYYVIVSESEYGAAKEGGVKLYADLGMAELAAGRIAKNTNEDVKILHFHLEKNAFQAKYKGHYSDVWQYKEAPAETEEKNSDS